MKVKTLPRMRCTRARPNSPIFFNWTHKNIPYRQHGANFLKSKKNVQCHCTLIELWLRRLFDWEHELWPSRQFNCSVFYATLFTFFIMYLFFSPDLLRVSTFKFWYFIHPLNKLCCNKYVVFIIFGQIRFSKYILYCIIIHITM